MTEAPSATARPTYMQPEHGWTCFHCGETFHAVGLAETHFGKWVNGEPACRLNQKERGLAYQLRQAEEQLERYHAEDSDTDRAMHGMKADHAVALIREEEKGYARGVSDMRNERETLLKLLNDALDALEAACVVHPVASERHAEVSDAGKCSACEGMAELRRIRAALSPQPEGGG